jgi:hypothetical protein
VIDRICGDFQGFAIRLAGDCDCMSRHCRSPYRKN